MGLSARIFVAKWVFGLHVDLIYLPSIVGTREEGMDSIEVTAFVSRFARLTSHWLR